VVYRGGEWFDGLLKTTVRFHGLDATDRIRRMVRSSSHYGQVRVLMLDGHVFAGFNVVDIQRLYKGLNRPVIVFLERTLDLQNIKSKMRSTPLYEERLKLLEKAGRPIPVKDVGYYKTAYLQVCGIDIDDAKEIVKIITTRNRVPEPLRVARMIASALGMLHKDFQNV